MKMKVPVATLVGSSAIVAASAGGLRGQERTLQMGLGKFKYLQVAEVGYDYTTFSPDRSSEAQKELLFDFEVDYRGQDTLQPFSTVQVVDNLNCDTSTVNTTLTSEKSLVESLEKGISFEVAATIPIERRRLQTNDQNGTDPLPGKKNGTDPLPAPTLKGKFSQSSTYKQVSSESSKDFYKSYMAQFVCQVKTVTIAKDKLPSLNSAFVQRIYDMYVRAHLGQSVLKPMAEAIVNDYGTHYIGKAAIGASYTRSFSLQGRSSEASYMTDTSNKNSAALSLCDSASIGVSTETDESKQNYAKFEKSTTVDIASSVGLAPRGDGSSSRAATIHDWQQDLIDAGKRGDSSKLGLIVIPTDHSLSLVPICDLLVWGPFVETQFKRLDHLEANNSIDESRLVEAREALYRAIYTKCGDCAEPKDGHDMYKNQSILIDENQRWMSKVWGNPFNGHPNKHTPTKAQMIGDIAESSSPNVINQAIYIDSITLAKGVLQPYRQSTVMGIRINYKNVEKNNAANPYDFGVKQAVNGDVQNTAYIGGRDIIEVQVFSGDLLEGMRFVLKEDPSGTSLSECIGSCSFGNPASFKAPTGGRLIGFGYQLMDNSKTKDNSDTTFGVLYPMWAH